MRRLSRKTARYNTVRSSFRRVYGNAGRTAWPPDTGGGSLPPAGRQPGGVLRLRAPLPHPGGLRGGVQGPLQSGRKAVRAVRLRERGPLRSHRKEAVLPRASGDWRAELWHARLRPSLRILPELGFFPGAARHAFDPGFSGRDATEIGRAHV